MQTNLSGHLKRIAEQAPPRGKKVVVGFDAVVDTLARAIKRQNPNGALEYFRTMEEYGDYLIGKAGLSCCIQLETITEKMGGNMAILSAALIRFGAPVELIGTLEGCRDHPAFAPLNGSVVHSLNKPGHCTALEFENGKVMMAGRGFLDFSFERLCETVGRETLGELVTHADLLCLVNWSEMRSPNDIWHGISSLVREAPGDKNKTVFFDLSDCSSHLAEDLKICIQIMKAIAKERKTVLSLNKNEAQRLAEALRIWPGTDLQRWGKELADTLELDLTIIHTNRSSYAWDAAGKVFAEDSFHTDKPSILTGGGDNFNAGFCLGLLMELDIPSCLLLANANSGYYIRYGGNVGLEGLLTFISEMERG